MQALFSSCYVNACYNLRTHQSLSAIILRQEMISKGVERAILEAVANVVDKLDNKALVVNRQQRPRQALLGPEQVADIGRSVVLAGVAIALRHNRCKHFAIFRPTHIHPPMRCVGCAIARYASWAYTIEGINTLLDRRKDVIWIRYAKQMPRAVLGQDLVYPLDSLSHRLFL